MSTKFVHGAAIMFGRGWTWAMYRDFKKGQFDDRLRLVAADCS